ncbi:hypothetical protein [Streptomyces zaomyceticus]|uniref:hypothetical protein n=1 Tax=Streptomyces zaomyceticus TaxID=68286 RepID=UPI002E0E9F63|nr:hypothetical protein OG237_34070 [Streptomyces zaomyceticus]
MSYGLAYPSISEIVPTVGYPASATTGTADLASLADGAGQSVGHAVDGVQATASHAMDAAGHALQELLEPAAVALGALSGALLVGRAAMVTTQALTAAAVRAADEQRCLEHVQQVAAAATAQWEAAAFAAVRANARRSALVARVRRAAFRTVPDTPPPPMPDLPPPLTCVGTRLDVLRRELAAMEKALRHAEALQDRWTMEQALGAADGPEDEDWRRRLLARREAAVRAQQEEPAPAAPAVPPQPPAADLLDRRRTEESGAELLALLEAGADPKDAELAVAAVRHAVECAAERPAKARNHLREARRFVTDANRAVRTRLAAQEKAAVQLDFLLTEAPPGEPPLAPAAEEIALLRGVLEKGRTLDADEQRTVDRRVGERLADLESRYTRELIGLAVARFADPTARGAVPADADAAAHGGAAGPLCLDLTPAGWWPDHWLRITVRDNVTEMVTMHAERPGPRGTAELALDARRCHEARGHLEELREAGLRLGIDLPVHFEESGSVVPGVRGGDGAIVLDMADVADAADAEARRTRDGTVGASEARRSEPPRARRVDEDRRSTGR